MSGIQLGGPKSWKCKTFKDIGIAYHWINDEPSMVLFAAQLKQTRGAFVIPLNCAIDYVDSNGYPTEWAINRAHVAAEVMGLDQTRPTIMNIVDAILDGIEDLIAMPPEPDLWKKAIGDAVLKMDGKVVSEAVLHS